MKATVTLKVEQTVHRSIHSYLLMIQSTQKDKEERSHCVSEQELKLNSGKGKSLHSSALRFVKETSLLLTSGLLTWSSCAFNSSQSLVLGLMLHFVEFSSNKNVEWLLKSNVNDRSCFYSNKVYAPLRLIVHLKYFGQLTDIVQLQGDKQTQKHSPLQ